MAKSAAQKLYDTGLEAFDAAGGDIQNYRDRAFLAAVANMLAEATAPKKRKPSGRTRDDREAGEKLYEILRENCPNTLAYEPVNTNTFSVVGKKLRDAGTTNEDVATLVQWFHTGPFDWRDTPPTWGELVRKIWDWLALAKAHHISEAKRKSLLTELRSEEEL